MQASDNASAPARPADKPAAAAAAARPAAATQTLDVVVVGAGFGGLYALHRLRGLGLTVRVIEAGSDVGGVWYWNRYPGARCDVESMQYSYGFDEALQQAWQWGERYAGQPEILAYARHVAERFELRGDIQFDTRVTAAHWRQADGRWAVHTDAGQVLSARFCIMATGCLSAARLPEIACQASFAGPILHTGHWPHAGVDFSGQRVGVIGTGSSGIQAIPEIARQAAQLTVFQRTPNFSIPARNVAMDQAYERSWKDHYPALREQAREQTTSGTVYERSSSKALDVAPEQREHEYQRRWQHGGVNFMHAFSDLMLDTGANQTAADFVRQQIRQTVHDPAVAERLLPRDHPIGSKRICVDSDYYATYNRPNVTLVDLRQTPIVGLTRDGLQTEAGFHPLDALVLATGYDAMTGALNKIDITGHGGQTLRQQWQDGPRAYLGLMVAGFPNLFTLTGPGSPSVLSNMVFAIEQHVDWIADCVAWLQQQGWASIDADGQAQEDWVAQVNALADRTLYPQANSWYVGANIPGKARVFMPYAGGVVPYRRKCEEVAARGYEGFHLRKTAPAAP